MISSAHWEMCCTCPRTNSSLHTLFSGPGIRWKVNENNQLMVWWEDIKRVPVECSEIAGFDYMGFGRRRCVWMPLPVAAVNSKCFCLSMLLAYGFLDFPFIFCTACYHSKPEHIDARLMIRSLFNMIYAHEDRRLKEVYVSGITVMGDFNNEHLLEVPS